MFKKMKQTNLRRFDVMKILDIGLSTEETCEKQFEYYMRASEYRGGKTFRELLDEANAPRKRKI